MTSLMLSPTLLLVVMYVPSCLALRSLGLYASRTFVCLSCICYFRQTSPWVALVFVLPVYLFDYFARVNFCPSSLGDYLVCFFFHCDAHIVLGSHKCTKNYIGNQGEDFSTVKVL